jgi:prepilin-type N-terminal cleavage/methylation domain-containing protein
MPTATYHPIRRAGFTLVEIAIVVMMIGLVAGIALPRLDLGKYRADSAAQTARGALQAAQRAALTRQYDVMVSVDAAGGRIRLVYDADGDGRLSSGERSTWQSLPDGSLFAAPSVGGLSGPNAKAFSGTAIRTVDGMPTLTYHRDGSASGDAELYVATRVGAKRAWRALQVTRATGRVDWFRFGASWTRGGL